MANLKVEKVQDGLVVDRRWLRSKGIDAPLVDYYVKKGYLDVVARGAYRRPGNPLKWQHLVYSLQELGYEIHVGGRSALEQVGLAHYLPLGDVAHVHVFSKNKLPSWIFKTDVKVIFHEHNLKLFHQNVKDSIKPVPFGSWDWLIHFSSSERAMLEMLESVPAHESFHMVETIFEAAVNLRPPVLMNLLMQCKSVKVKRLFLYFARNFNHQWFNYLDLNKIKIGSGKRVVYENGKLDKEYLITVPKAESNYGESIF